MRKLLFLIPLLTVCSCTSKTNPFIDNVRYRYATAASRYWFDDVKLNRDYTFIAHRNYQGNEKYWEGNFTLNEGVITLPWHDGEKIELTYNYDEMGDKVLYGGISFSWVCK